MTATFSDPTADFYAIRYRAIRPHRFASVIAATAEAAGLTPKDILGRDKRAHVAQPRQIAMTLCLDIPGASSVQVARVFHRDHSTILHARRTITERMTPEMADAIGRIRAKAGLVTT